MTAVDAATWNSTAFWSEEAEQQFAKARGRARRERLVALLSGRCDRLESFQAVREQLQLLPVPGRRLAMVPLDHVIGTLGKVDHFTRSFHPKSGRLRPRWKRVYALVRGLRGIDPIELYQVGEDYYVVDGHYRMSVARALKSSSIEAVIRRWA